MHLGNSRTVFDLFFTLWLTSICSCSPPSYSSTEVTKPGQISSLTIRTKNKFGKIDKLYFSSPVLGHGHCQLRLVEVPVHLAHLEGGHHPAEQHVVQGDGLLLAEEHLPLRNKKVKSKSNLLSHMFLKKGGVSSKIFEPCSEALS